MIVLCFAVDSPDSLHNATTKWAQELRRYCPKVPILLVGELLMLLYKKLRTVESTLLFHEGNKRDLRTDELTLRRLLRLNAEPVRAVDGAGAALALGACHYVECSAKTGSNVEEVFERAAAIGLKHRADRSCGWIRRLKKSLM